MFDFSLAPSEEDQPFLDMGAGLRQAFEQRRAAQYGGQAGRTYNQLAQARASTAAMERKGFLGRYGAITDEATVYHEGGGFHRNVQPFFQDYISGGGGSGGTESSGGAAVQSADIASATSDTTDPGFGTTAMQGYGKFMKGLGKVKDLGGVKSKYGLGQSRGAHMLMKNMSGAKAGAKGAKGATVAGFIMDRVGKGIKGYLQTKYGGRAPEGSTQALHGMAAGASEDIQSMATGHSTAYEDFNAWVNSLMGEG